MEQLIKTYFKRTKIVATLGPSITQKIFTWDQFNDPKNQELVKKAYENMEEIIKAGVNCVRLNFSHGDYEEQLIRIKIVRDVAKKLNRNIAIMLDTKGPEIRVSSYVDKKIEIKADSQVDIYTIKTIAGDAKSFSVTDSTGTYNMANDVKKGSIILVDDGKLELYADEIDPSSGIIRTVALNTHTITNKKRINLPGSNYTLPFLSEKDKKDILFACDNNLDYIATSFTNSKANIDEVREILRKQNNFNIKIIAKIETGNGIENLDDIIEASDGIMVARGDLALEIPYYDVPYWQKQMIRKCRYAGKPCIVATQMLDSLERNIQPTRAEVTDVFFAVERGADATMLSGESAQGQFPINAVETMANIDVKSELLFDYDRAINVYFKKTKFPKYIKQIAKKIANELKPIGEQINPSFKYNFLVLFSDDKQLVRAISNIRPAATIILITSEKELINEFAINYAIQTWYVENLNDAKEKYQQVATKVIRSLNHENVKAIAFFNKSFHKLVI